MNQNQIDVFGDELYNALITRTRVASLTDREPGITLDDAYRIQLRMIQRRLDAGETLIGKKIGVTSKVVMDMLKVNQPDFGQMTSGMVFNEGEAIRVDSNQHLHRRRRAGLPGEGRRLPRLRRGRPRRHFGPLHLTPTGRHSMNLDNATLLKLADHLETAELKAYDVTKITDDHPDMDWDDAYAIAVQAGDNVAVRFQDLGTVSMRFA